MTQLFRTIALVGMMGAGKSSVGRRLATRLGVPFRDADAEIEAAAGRSIAEIFESFGEAEFREGERRVIARLLGEAPHVLATGGGAFLDPGTRAAMKAGAFTIWLRVPLALLVARVGRRETRPLLKNGDVGETMARLLEAREPFYAEADLAIDSEDESHVAIVEKIVAVLKDRLLYGEP